MIERVRPIEVDLPQRRELRFILPIEKQSQIFSLLHEGFEEKFFSDRKINRTIYFNNQDHEVPWEYALKARQYHHNRTLTDNNCLDAGESYFAEIKISSGESEKSKKRFEMSLEQAPRFFLENVPRLILTSPLRPYIVTEYERFHFQPDSNCFQGLRITCDISPSYFLIDENRILHFLGQEQSVRIEVKIAQNQDISMFQCFVNQLESLGSRKIISKKISAYSLEADYYKSMVGRSEKELPNMEIESKLIVVDKDPFLFFNQLAVRMRKGIGDFVIPRTFPHVIETGSFNTYYQSERDKDDMEGVKLMVKPTGVREVLKLKGEVVSDPYSLKCILKRKELKGEHFSLDELPQILKREKTNIDVPLKYVGETKRLRKVFRVINRRSLREYHVSIDRCQAKGSILYELEVEYTGTKGRISDYTEPEIIKDIADLTRGIIESNPLSVRPEPLTKIDWLRS